MKAEICCGEYCLPWLSTHASPVGPLTILNGDELLILRNLGIVEAPSDQAFDCEKRVRRVGDPLTLCRQTDETLVVGGKCNNRRRRVGALGILQNFRFSALHDGDARVGRAEVDTDNFSHSRQSFLVAADRVDPVTGIQRARPRGVRSTGPQDFNCVTDGYISSCFRRATACRAGEDATLKRRSYETLAHTFASKRVRFRACFKELIYFPPASRSERKVCRWPFAKRDRGMPSLHRFWKSQDAAAKSSLPKGGSAPALLRLCGLRTALRDDDHRRTQAAILEQIADLIDLQHGAGRNVGVFLLHHGLVVMRIEGLGRRDRAS